MSASAARSVRGVALSGPTMAVGACSSAWAGRARAPALALPKARARAPVVSGNRRQLQVHAGQTVYKAARRMRLRVRDENPEHRFEEYFKNVERVVNVTFPDEDRRTFLEPGKWEVRLLPIQFFFIRFQAVNVIRAWAREDGMNLAVSDLLLDGAPPELELNEKLNFDLKGQLRVIRTPADVATGEEAKTVLDGVVAMTLGADIPAVFASNPGVDQLSQQIMDTILKNLEVSLVKGLTTDYRAWVKEVETAELVA